MAHSGLPELPDFIAILAGHFKNNLFLKYIYLWEYVFFAVFTAVIICLIAYFATQLGGGCKERKGEKRKSERKNANKLHGITSFEKKNRSRVKGCGHLVLRGYRQGLLRTR